MITKQRYSREIEDAIAKARFSRSRATVTAEDGTEVMREELAKRK